ncbi:ABC transporter ATP-binding protein/permease (plasmid) [Streptomyces atratus]|uniref:ABC-type multidrug transport system, ATPase and permease component n=2 Tax=Streptomyces atratus TaxID=1893 RepID=A0A1K1ZUE7_STRAR|nr:ABC transporter ATP-binding protein [Streptomyces atratus]SFX77284.1 ABC-type multidrug transport system, ATPase and permease component [Streptomyces atratus]
MTASEAGPEKASVLEAAAWREIVRYLTPHRKPMVLATVLTLCGALIGLSQPLMTKWIIGALGRGGALTGPLLLLTAALVGGAVLNAVGYYLLGRVAETVVLTSRREMVSRILRMRIGETHRIRPGDLMSRVASDTTLLRQAAGQTLVDALKGVLMLVAIVVLMGLLDLFLLTLTLAVLLAAAVLIGCVVPLFRRYSTKVQEAIGDLTAVLERMLGGFRTVKASGAERQEAEKLDAATFQAWSFGLRLARLGGVVSAGALLAVHLSFLVVLGVGGGRVASGAIPVGTLIAFLLYLFALIEPVAGLIAAASTFGTAVAAVRRIREVRELDVEPVLGEAVVSPGEAVRTPVGLAFRGVRFRYPGPDTPRVLHGVDLDIPPRGMTAVVGPSGAGKSTLFSLIERFYDPVGGSVLVDGTDVRDWPLEELRAAIGYVEQDAPVLAGTLRENLLLGIYREVPDEEIHAVLARTRLSAVVDRLPAGVDTPVGHRGSTLSGGERQRIAIARALLRRPRLLLLDEATSQLDAVNEASLRDVVLEVAREFTVLVVAHRLSTVTRADRIVVMEAGRVRAAGSHEELVRKDMLYQELAATQLLVPDAPEGAPGAGAATAR